MGQFWPLMPAGPVTQFTSRLHIEWRRYAIVPRPIISLWIRPSIQVSYSLAFGRQVEKDQEGLAHVAWATVAPRGILARTALALTLTSGRTCYAPSGPKVLQGCFCKFRAKSRAERIAPRRHIYSDYSGGGQPGSALRCQASKSAMRTIQAVETHCAP
jgi:hypothetical protein